MPKISLFYVTKPKNEVFSVIEVPPFRPSKQQAGRTKQRFMPAGFHGCSALVLCLIWLCILCRVSDKNLKLAAKE